MTRYTPGIRLAALLLIGVSASACSAAGEERAPAPVASTLEGTVFVANKRGDSLSMIDLASGAEVKRVDACENPHELAVSPDKSHVALACYAGTDIDIFATDSLEKVHSVTLGDGARPHGIVWHANGQIVATAEGRGTIFVIADPLGEDPQVRELGENKGAGPHMVAVDAGFTTAWGVAIPTSTTIRYDLASGQETARKVLSGQTEAVALSPDGSSLWVGANADAKLYRLDPNSLEVQHEIGTGPVPIRVAAHPSGEWVVTSDVGDGSLSVIAAGTNEVARRIEVSGGNEAVQVTLVFSEDGSRLYAAETRANTIAEIDFASGDVLRRFATGEGGDGLAVLDRD